MRDVVALGSDVLACVPRKESSRKEMERKILILINVSYELSPGGNHGIKTPVKDIVLP
jgi:hypothetical protein